MSIRTLFRSKQVPDAVKAAFKYSLLPSGPEQVLWREAAVRHVLDAFGVVEQGEQHCVVEARRWFANSHDDVQLLFEFAGVDLFPIAKALEPELCLVRKSLSSSPEKP